MASLNVSILPLLINFHSIDYIAYLIFLINTIFIELFEGYYPDSILSNDSLLSVRTNFPMIYYRVYPVSKQSHILHLIWIYIGMIIDYQMIFHFNFLINLLQLIIFLILFYSHYLNHQHFYHYQTLMMTLYYSYLIILFHQLLHICKILMQLYFQ